MECDICREKMMEGTYYTIEVRIVSDRLTANVNKMAIKRGDNKGFRYLSNIVKTVCGIDCLCKAFARGVNDLQSICSDKKGIQVS